VTVRIEPRPRLTVLEGGRSPLVRVGGLRIVVAPRDRSPFAVEALATEEDTYLVLSTPPRLPLPAQHPIRVMTSLWELEPEPPGTVVVREGSPLRLLAVVHDLDQDPTWREDWVVGALDGILRQAALRQLTALAVPLLGCRHGRLRPERFVELLMASLGRLAPEGLQRLWLMTPRLLEQRVKERLRQLAPVPLLSPH
jgi:hypothetical protein